MLISSIRTGSMQGEGILRNKPVIPSFHAVCFLLNSVQYGNFYCSSMVL